MSRPVLICLLLVAMLASVSAEIIPSAERWINRLNATSVNAMDEQILSQRFDDWIAGLPQLGKPMYLVVSCEEAATQPQQKEGKADAKEIPVCVIVEASAGPMRRLQLKFLVASRLHSELGDVQVIEKALKIELVSGMLGPSNPASKQPAQLIRKLGEVEKMLK